MDTPAALHASFCHFFFSFLLISVSSLKCGLEVVEVSEVTVQLLGGFGHDVSLSHSFK